ncbi:MAG: T9SS type A sorting domain-containing protein, partial [Candidatus Latescibacteria bacterium]|nr:T9SS type A sorting domain-containing protein [Candidatus Latescibacterota bacterium]
TSVAIPAEQLHTTPNHNSEELFPLVRSIRFRTAQPVFLDEIQLRAPGRGLVTAVMEDAGAALPRWVTLQQNYPNPFNSSTVFRFALPTSVQTDLTIYNLAGQQVATLLSGLREAGTYTLQWDGRDEQGGVLATGVYFYRLQAGAQVQTRKLLLLR